MMLVPTDLGERGRSYIRGRLEGGLSLSAMVVERVNLDAGDVFTWAPERPPPHLFEFDSERLSADEDGFDIVGPFVSDFFASVSGGSLWVEDFNAKRSDPFWDNPAIARGREAAWFCDEEVYALAFPGDSNEAILGALRNGQWWSGWGGGSFLSASPIGGHYRTANEIDRNDLQEIASDVLSIICGAYDGEGWLVWQVAGGG